MVLNGLFFSSLFSFFPFFSGSLILFGLAMALDMALNPQLKRAVLAEEVLPMHVADAS